MWNNLEQFQDFDDKTQGRVKSGFQTRTTIKYSNYLEHSY